MSLIPMKITNQQNKVTFIIGDGTVVYETDINSFEINSGVTIHNVELNSLKGYYVNLEERGKTFKCGYILDNILLELNKEVNNILLIIDFDKVEEVSESFFEKYTKFLLETKNKVIHINMNPSIESSFGIFIKSNIEQVEE